MQPHPQLVKGQIGFCTHLRLDRIMQSGKLARHMTPLRPRPRFPSLLTPLPSFDHIRDAHPKAGRNLTACALRRQHPLPEIVRIRLPIPPCHCGLRSTPDTYESQMQGAPEPPIAIQVSLKPL
ncbi:hypothetical protein Asru_0458_03 [Acidisphaera rubrifaciens HS-AP3]|uniref:Uncharacterized protein n=1 Tax=Acidisphaera rubrifaciens HS-AP3 TaxID=1231350 RepID=A0A0D6PA79_9PROT|nr:hypothetical protein Asru_0458_03 [Acidisphaera rubrifaciens HS-AP3]